MPLIEIADFNRDGMFDIIYPRPETQEIVVLYNQLLSADEKSENLCNADSDSISKIFKGKPRRSSEKALVHKIGRQLQLASPFESFPGRLRIADIDHDGYVDVIMTLQNYDGSTVTYLYANVASGNYTSARDLSASSSLDDVIGYAGSTAKLMTFMDVDEDGRLDYLIQD